MKLVYTHPNALVVENAKNICLNAGLEVMLHNQFAGGAVGELAPISAWPELWVRRDRDYDQAVKLIEAAFVVDAEREEPDWLCGRCGEQNNAAFELCWRCQALRHGPREGD